MESLDIKTMSVFIGLVVVNLGAFFGAYVKLRVSVAQLEVLVSKLEDDVNNLGKMLRTMRKTKDDCDK